MRIRVLFGKVAARRRRMAHERYLQERDWQRMLAEKQTGETIREAALMWGVTGQATSGPGGEL
jgi:hypothetical protein